MTYLCELIVVKDSGSEPLTSYMLYKRYITTGYSQMG